MKTKINWRNSIGFVVDADNIRLQKTNSRAAVRGRGVNFRLSKRSRDSSCQRLPPCCGSQPRRQLQAS